MTIFIVSVLVLLFLLWYSFPIIEVVGCSMFPTYNDGEFIVGTRLYLKSNLKVGDVIVFKTPTDGKTVIKRISSIEGSKFYCLGDNADYSYDSRHYGFIPRKNVDCRVIKPRVNKRIQSEGGIKDE